MPSRRQVLATLPPMLAGCSSSPSVSGPTRTPTATPPEMIESCRAMPDPPADPTPAETREFVAAYEEARVYNWLVAQNGGPDECRPDGPGSMVNSAGVAGAIDVTTEFTETAIVAETDAGYYVVSSCSAQAEYWCRDEGRPCSHAGRNAHFVTHFVGDSRHLRIPHNWFACHARDDPYRSANSDKNIELSADEPGLTFRVYAFSEDVGADVTLTSLDAGEQVLQKTYSPNVGPAVQSNVTVATGDYRLVAETDDKRIVHEFSLADRDSTTWNGLCIYVGPDTLHLVEVATEGRLAVPEGTCSEHRTRNDETASDSA